MRVEHIQISRNQAGGQTLTLLTPFLCTPWLKFCMTAAWGILGAGFGAYEPSWQTLTLLTPFLCIPWWKFCMRAAWGVLGAGFGAYEPSSGPLHSVSNVVWQSWSVSNNFFRPKRWQRRLREQGQWWTSGREDILYLNPLNTTGSTYYDPHFLWLRWCGIFRSNVDPDGAVFDYFMWLSIVN
jgi:hypothetical protein